MLLEVAELLQQFGFLFNLAMFLAYFFLKAEGMYKLIAVLILISVVNKLLFNPLYALENAKYYWYVTWAFMNLVFVAMILIVTKKHPNIQKVTIPVCILAIVSIILELSRHYERNILDTDYLKKLYSIGIPTLSWLISAYLFAPLALLLVKYVKGRFSAKH
ncbi:hypothetical protein [Kangiella sp. TOML190]|uniref:hypothetical protein n=1 Tax=Kangiella sp. TOML190 TaxID=2931351 RepID=UPI00203E5D13|nr:hypothetical protein [Kangiella sp. TOML190]